jgi:hypothetical protein
LSNFAFAQPDIWDSLITDGFSDPEPLGVIEFVEFKDELYAVTQHKVSAGAAEVWKSATGDPSSWTQVNFDPGNAAIKGIVSFCKSELDSGYLWLGTLDGLNGTQIYRTSDGISWTTINSGGFADNRTWFLLQIQI